jgi:transposase
VIDLRGSIPVFVALTTGKVHDVKRLTDIELQANATVVLDRGYIDFAKLYSLGNRCIYFVIRAKANMRIEQVCALDFEPGTGVQSDHSIKLATAHSFKAYPQLLRRVSFYDEDTKLHLVFLTNRYDLSALTIAQIYKERWKIELFFKWLKQNLALNHFFGNSENAVKAQIWIVVSVYLMVLIARKTLKLDISMQLLMHALEANMFDNRSLAQLVQSTGLGEPEVPTNQQLELL